MKAFRVFINGQVVCTAGVGGDGVLSASVSWTGAGQHGDAEGRMQLYVGGLDRQTNEHVRWNVPNLRVGDEVSILVVESEQVDPADDRCKAERPGNSRARARVERK